MDKNVFGINKCGWPDKKYNYLSWTLSLLQFRKYYDSVELVTDKAGYDLLINKMELPYTSVKVVLDDLNDYHPDLYALGKVYAYSIQEEPFIHVDGDVFVWSRFNDSLENAPLVCQHREKGEYYTEYYTRIFVEIMQNFDFYPEALDSSISRNNGIVAINAGILGGNSLSFLKEYAKESLGFVQKNISRLHKIDVTMFNVIFEQFLFYALAEEKQQPVTYYYPGFKFFWPEITDYTGIPNRTKYLHTIGAKKRERYITDALEHRVLCDYPEYYYRIMNLVRTNKI